MWCPHWTRKHMWHVQWHCELFQLLIGFVWLRPAYLNLLPNSTSSFLQSGSTMMIFFLLRRKCKWMPLMATHILKVCHANSCSRSHWQPFYIVRLASSMDSQLETAPILVLKITTSERFTDIADAESMRTSLEINPRLTSAFGCISLLVKIGSVISEVSVHSQYSI